MYVPIYNITPTLHHTSIFVCPSLGRMIHESLMEIQELPPELYSFRRTLGKALQYRNRDSEDYDEDSGEYCLFSRGSDLSIQMNQQFAKMLLVSISGRQHSQEPAMQEFISGLQQFLRNCAAVRQPVAG